MFVNLLPKESLGSVFRVLCVMGCLTPAVAQAGFDWTPPAPAVVPPPVSAAQAPVVPSGPLTPEPDALPVPVGSVEAEAAPLTPAPSKPPVQVPAVPARPFVAEDTTTPLVIDNTKQNLSPSAESVIEPKDDEGEGQKKIADVPSAPDQATDPAPLITESTSSSAVTTSPEADREQIAASPSTTPAVVVPTPISTSAPDLVEGFGKDIPLAIALRDIVPPHYAFSFSPREIAGTKISWRGGKPWQDVLKDALTPHDLDLVMNEGSILILRKATAVSGKDQETTGHTMIANRSGVQSPSLDSVPVLDTNSESSAPGSPEPLLAAKPDPSRAFLAMDLKAVRKWQARPGTTLRETLESWSKESNVELNWSTPYDYPINNAFYFDGEFTHAVDSLLSSYRSENPSPKGRLYPNLPEGPSVLMID